MSKPDVTITRVDGAWAWGTHTGRIGAWERGKAEARVLDAVIGCLPKSAIPASDREGVPELAEPFAIVFRKTGRLCGSPSRDRAHLESVRNNLCGGAAGAGDPIVVRLAIAEVVEPEAAPSGWRYTIGRDGGIAMIVAADSAGFRFVFDKPDTVPPIDREHVARLLEVSRG